jgi:hypothetical protein
MTLAALGPGHDFTAPTMIELKGIGIVESCFLVSSE